MVLVGQYHPQGLVEWCRPEFVVISGGHDFELGRDPDAVAREFYRAGSNILHTSQHGAVRFQLSQDGVHLATHRSPPENSSDSVYWTTATNEP